MADHLEEQEQIEAIKQWFKDNFLTIFVPIILVALGYVGWGVWQSQQENKARAGSEAFTALLEKVETSQQGTLSDETALDVANTAQSVASDYEKTLYADMARLLGAKIDVEKGRIEDAQAKLEKVADTAANAGVKELAKVRLAKLFEQKGEYQKALALVESTNVAGFDVLFAEVRGDIALAQGDRATANNEYEKALSKLSPLNLNRRAILELKSKSTAVASTTVETPDESSQTQTESEGA